MTYSEGEKVPTYGLPDPLNTQREKNLENRENGQKTKAPTAKRMRPDTIKMARKLNWSPNSSRNSGFLNTEVDKRFIRKS